MVGTEFGPLEVDVAAGSVLVLRVADRPDSRVRVSYVTSILRNAGQRNGVVGSADHPEAGWAHDERAIMKKLIAGAVLGLVVVGGPSAVFAGEINGNGKPTQGPAHANSICAFSGLEDGDGAGFPGPGGAPPQNWGHVRQFLTSDAGGNLTPAQIKASGEQPGDSCNGHRGFLAGGGTEG